MELNKKTLLEKVMGTTWGRVGTRLFASERLVHRTLHDFGLEVAVFLRDLRAGVTKNL